MTIHTRRGRRYGARWAVVSAMVTTRIAARRTSGDPSGLAKRSAMVLGAPAVEVMREILGALLGIGPGRVDRANLVPECRPDGQPRQRSAAAVILRPEALLRLPHRGPVAVVERSQRLGVEGIDHGAEHSEPSARLPAASRRHSSGTAGTGASGAGAPSGRA